jgi:hypothetical protein
LEQRIEMGLAGATHPLIDLWRRLSAAVQPPVKEAKVYSNLPPIAINPWSA